MRIATAATLALLAACSSSPTPPEPVLNPSDAGVMVTAECGSYLAEPTAITLDEEVLLGVTIDASHALLVSASRSTIVTRAGEGTTRQSPTLYYISAQELEDGSFLIGGGEDMNSTDVWFARASITEGFTDLRRDHLGATGRVIGLDRGLSTSGGTQIFALSFDGIVWFYDGQTWARLASVGTSPYATRIVHAGDGEAFVLFNDHHIESVRPGSNTTIDAPPQVRAMASIPDLGIVIGTMRGELYLREAGAWRALEGTGTNANIMNIRPHPDGFIYQLASGAIGAYVRGKGFCNEVPVLFTDILGPTVGGDIVLLNDRAGTWGVTMLRRQ